MKNKTEVLPREAVMAPRVLLAVDLWGLSTKDGNPGRCPEILRVSTEQVCSMFSTEIKVIEMLAAREKCNYNERCVT